MKSSVFIWIFISLISFNAFAEKIYTKIYTYEEVLTAYRFLKGNPLDGSVNIFEDQYHDIRKTLERAVENYSEKTKVEFLKAKKQIRISSNLETIYGVVNLLGDPSYFRDFSTQFMFELYEVKNNERLLKFSAKDLTLKQLKTEPKENIEKVAKLELITDDYDSVVMKSGKHKVKVTKDFSTFKSQFHVFIDWESTGEVSIKYRTFMYMRNEQSYVIQVQTKDDMKSKNLYMVISAKLLNVELKKAESLLLEDVKKLEDEISKRNKNPKRMISRSFAVPVGILDFMEERVDLGGPQDLGPLIVDDFEGPSFQREFRKILNVKLGPECKMIFAQAYMRLYITAPKDELQKIEQYLIEKREYSKPEKVNFRLLEVPNKLLEEAPEILTNNFIEKLPLTKIKTLENFHSVGSERHILQLHERVSKLKRQKLDLNLDLIYSPSNKKYTLGVNMNYAKNNIIANCQDNFKLEKAEKVFLLSKQEGRSLIIAISSHSMNSKQKYWYGN